MDHDEMMSTELQGVTPDMKRAAPSERIEVQFNPPVPISDSLTDLTAYKKFRDDLDKFIGKNFQRDVHYGEPFKDAGKDTILLPGAQAIARLTKTKPMFFPDMELFTQFGKTPGVMVMKCYLVPYDIIPYIAEQVVKHGVDKFEPLCKMYCLSEGRGAGYIAEKKNTLKENMIVKMTQVRSLRDAAIRVADLSDKYAQDLDDYDKEDLGFFDDLTKGDKEKTDEKPDTTTPDILGDNDVELPEGNVNPLAEEKESTEEGTKKHEDEL